MNEDELSVEELEFIKSALEVYIAQLKCVKLEHYKYGVQAELCSGIDELIKKAETISARIEMMKRRKFYQ